jgi:hypothetical protein
MFDLLLLVVLIQHDEIVPGFIAIERGIQNWESIKVGPWSAGPEAT